MIRALISASQRDGIMAWNFISHSNQIKQYHFVGIDRENHLIWTYHHDSVNILPKHQIMWISWPPPLKVTYLYQIYAPEKFLRTSRLIFQILRLPFPVLLVQILLLVLGRVNAVHVINFHRAASTGDLPEMPDPRGTRNSDQNTQNHTSSQIRGSNNHQLYNYVT